MLTKLSNAFSKLKPQPSAAASAAPEAKAEETPSDKPEAETEEKKEVGVASVLHIGIASHSGQLFPGAIQPVEGNS